MKKQVYWLIPLLVISCTKPPMLSTAKNAQDAYEECHEYTEAGHYEKANQCFDLLRSRFSGTTEAIEAEIEIADNYFRQKDYLVSAEAYRGFAKLHPAYKRIDYVYYRTGQSYLKESPKSIDRDQQHLDDAIHYFTLTMNDPASEHREIAREKWLESRKRLAGRVFYIGRHYYRAAEYRAAIPRFEEILYQYPYLGYDEEALYLLGRSYLKLGNKEKCRDILAAFDKHYPKSRYRKKLARRLDLG
ncbi:MAG: outer membrane protein assembly factor BamD [Deltaproteobacteria bacterium]|nr:outer membrane protein assembly factor BamD [Deltaproteobacteria bacterium]